MRSFIRLFQKRRSYYLTNILGLTIGLAAAGFSILYFQHELGYDSFHSKANKIYRISHQYDAGWFAALNIKYIEALRQDTIPEIEEMTRIRRWFSKFVFVGDRKFYESKVMLTDPGSSFFDMFDFPFKEGVASKALGQPNSVVIASSLAKKYFGDKPALGETIMYDTMALTVTGVFEDLPTNTTFPFEILITNQSAMAQASGSYTYVILKEDTNLGALEEKILRAKVGDLHQPVTGIKIIPLRDLHFDGNFTYEMKTAGSRSYLWILGAIGGTILLIAFTNFINLSVALYARRSREIAVRKSVGASSALLSKQFYLESFITISLSSLLATSLIYLMTPWFNELMELRLANPLTSVPYLTGMVVVLPLMTIVAGAYPALILPRIHILDLFRQTGITTHHGLTLRMFLLGFQLIVLFFVCCSLWVILGQFNFMRNKDLGFSKEGVVKVRRSWMMDSARYQTLKAELRQHPAVEAVSEGFAPGDEDYGFTFRGENTEIMDGMLAMGTDYDYLTVLNIRPLEGAIASNDASTLPARSRVINQTLAKMLGYDDPIGRKLIINPGQKHEKTYVIDGVVADYHFNSLHHPIAPQLLTLNAVSTSVEENVLIKVNTNNIVEAVEFIRKKLDELVPDMPVEIAFLEADIEKLYKQETRLSKIVTILVSVSLLLSVVGLVALCSYMIEYRQREIAIRKVLGAATAGIVSLFAKVFVRTTMVAFVIGAPLCYWAMEKWIQAFAFREEISVSRFVFVLIGVLMITIGLAVAQTVKAARMNPVSVLKE